MKRLNKRNGFSLVELMIVVAVVAILVALALPSYSQYVRKAKRGEAQQLLVNWANNQEIWRSHHTTYANAGTTLGVPTHDNYTFSIAGVTSTTYTLTADPIGDQAKDKERGQLCDPLTLTESNSKGPEYSGVTYCWGN